MTPPPLHPLSVLAIRHGRGGGAAVPRLGARIVAVAVVALGVGALAGCTTEPEPAPTPTAAFANEEEAFAAAEKVYRAYNEAGNARRTGSPDADPQQFLVGAALESDMDTQNLLMADGLSTAGRATIISINGKVSEPAGSVSTVTMTVCTDVSALLLLDDAGADITPADRGEVVALEVVIVGDRQSLLISDASPTSGNPC